MVMEKMKLTEEEQKKRNEFLLGLEDDFNKIAGRYFSESTTVDDNIGYIWQGAMEAYDRYDESKNGDLRDFILKSAEFTLQRELRATGKMIRVPEYVQDRYEKLKVVEETYWDRYGKAPSFLELAQMTGINQEDIKNTYMMMQDMGSLNAEVSNDEKDNGNEVGDFVDSGVDVESEAFAAMEGDGLDKYFAALRDDRQRDIVKMAYGVGVEKQTQAEIAQRLGITRQAVSEILGDAKKRIGAVSDNVSFAVARPMDDIFVSNNGMEFGVGDVIMHSRSGRGTIEGFEGDRVLIKFDNQDEISAYRKNALNYCTIYDGGAVTVETEERLSGKDKANGDDKPETKAEPVEKVQEKVTFLEADSKIVAEYKQRLNTAVGKGLILYSFDEYLPKDIWKKKMAADRAGTACVFRVPGADGKYSYIAFLKKDGSNLEEIKGLFDTLDSQEIVISKSCYARLNGGEGIAKLLSGVSVRPDISIEYGNGFVTNSKALQKKQEVVQAAESVVAGTSGKLDVTKPFVYKFENGVEIAEGKTEFSFKPGTDMLKNKSQVIINTVNCVGVMGKGLALAYKQQYPEMFQDYRTVCYKDGNTADAKGQGKGELRPGNIYVYPLGNGRYIFNIPTKEHWRNPSKVEYVEKGLDALVQLINKLGIESVAVPKLGCANGGLDWKSEVGPLVMSKLAGAGCRIDVIGEPEGLVPTAVVEQEREEKQTELFKGLEELPDGTPNGFRDGFEFLSNMFESPIKVTEIEHKVVTGGKTVDEEVTIAYKSVENYFQAMKSSDINIHKMMAMLSPELARKNGRNLPLPADWQDRRLRVMEDALRLKFSQNPELAEKLVQTKGKIVEHNTWNDDFWGKCTDKGENRLGQLLMKLRDEFQQERVKTSALAVDVVKPVREVIAGGARDKSGNTVDLILHRNNRQPKPGTYTVAITGARPNKLPCGYDMRSAQAQTYIANFAKELSALADENSGIVIRVGGALGIDTLALKAALKAKEAGADIFIEAHIPCHGHELAWNERTREEYHADLDKCDSVKYTHERPYESAKDMQDRNEAMVNGCDVVYAYWNGDLAKSGTGNCVRYAHKEGYEVRCLGDYMFNMRLADNQPAYNRTIGKHEVLPGKEDMMTRFSVPSTESRMSVAQKEMVQALSIRERLEMIESRRQNRSMTFKEAQEFIKENNSHAEAMHSSAPVERTDNTAAETAAVEYVNENVQRHCELHKYVAEGEKVTVDRWRQFAGKIPPLPETKQEFEKVMLSLGKNDNIKGVLSAVVVGTSVSADSHQAYATALYKVNQYLKEAYLSPVGAPDTARKQGDMLSTALRTVGSKDYEDIRKLEKSAEGGRSSVVSLDELKKRFDSRYRYIYEAGDGAEKQGVRRIGYGDAVVKLCDEFKEMGLLSRRDYETVTKAPLAFFYKTEPVDRYCSGSTGLPITQDLTYCIGRDLLERMASYCDKYHRAKQNERDNMLAEQKEIRHTVHDLCAQYERDKRSYLIDMSKGTQSTTLDGFVMKCFAEAFDAMRDKTGVIDEFACKQQVAKRMLGVKITFPQSTLEQNKVADGASLEEFTHTEIAKSIQRIVPGDALKDPKEALKENLMIVKTEHLKRNPKKELKMEQPGMPSNNGATLE